MGERQRDVRLLVRVAQMYYEEGANQAEISERLGISKATVSRILSEAKEEGIVTITVNNPIAKGHINIEKEMEQRFGLREAIIVHSDAQRNDIKKDLAKSAARYLERIVKQGQTIGVSMGITLRNIPDFVQNKRKNNITFIPLLGGVGQTKIDAHPNHIALELARKFNGECKLLHAPAVVDSIQAKEFFTKDRYIQSILEMGEKVDIGIFGIGAPLANTSTLLGSGYYSNQDIEKLRKKGAVGDISSRFIDKYGRGDSFEFNERVIGISLEKIKEIPLSIGVAGHKEKAQAILAVLKGGYINVLITDHNTAQVILELDEKS